MKIPEGGEIRCCVTCRNHFPLTRDELAWLEERGFNHKPSHCPTCRAANRLRARLRHQNERRNTTVGPTLKERLMPNDKDAR